MLVPGAIGNEAFAALLRGERESTARNIADADFEHLINARRMRRMSMYVKLSICAATIAARDAGVFDQPELLRRAGAILGTTHGSAGYCYDYYAQVVREGLAAANPVLFAEGVPNAAAAQLSLAFGLTGSCQTVLGTRTAGLDALRLAAMRIEAGDSDRLIVVASEEAHATLDAAYQHCGDAGPSVSLAVALVVESRSAAEARGATLRATLGEGGSATAIGDETLTDLVRRASAPISDRQTLHRSIPLAGDPFSVAPLLALTAAVLRGDNKRIALLVADRSRLATTLAVDIL